MKFTDCIEIVGSKPTVYEGTKQYVSTGAVEEYFINKNSIEEYTYNERPSRADLVGKSGDILFAKMAETKKTLILDKETENYLFSTGFFAIRPKNGILTTKCLYYLLNSKNFLIQKDKNSSGATQKAITNAGLEKINVNIPLFSKQNQIVKQFDLLTDIIKKYQSQLKKLDSLIKSRFIEMFGTENDFSKWNCCFVEDVADVTVGVVIKPTQYYCEKGIPAFRSLNIGEMKVNDSDWVYFTEEGNEKNRKSILKENDVLVVRSGAPGKSCVITKKYEGYNVVDAIIAHPNLEKVNPVFLCMFTNMPHGMNQIKAKTGGAAQQHLNVGGYNSLKIKLPPLSLQNDFAAFVQQIDKSKFAVQKSLEKAEILYKSLMQQYFA